MERSKVNNSGTAKAKTKKISVILQINKIGIAEARTKTISVILQKNYSGTGKAMTITGELHTVPGCMLFTPVRLSPGVGF